MLQMGRVRVSHHLVVDCIHPTSLWDLKSTYLYLYANNLHNNSCSTLTLHPYATPFEEIIIAQYDIFLSRRLLFG